MSLHRHPLTPAVAGLIALLMVVPCASEASKPPDGKPMDEKGGHAVRVHVEPASGVCDFWWMENPGPRVVTGTRSADILKLIPQCRPDDTLLKDVRPCDRDKPDPSDFSPRQRLAEYIYVEELPEAINKVAPTYPAVWVAIPLKFTLN